MLSTKRKALDTGLQRRVRARRELSEELDASTSDSAPSEFGQNHDENSSAEEDGDSSDGSEDDVGEEGDEVRFTVLLWEDEVFNRVQRNYPNQKTEPLPMQHQYRSAH
jgi:hypothetical protein